MKLTPNRIPLDEWQNRVCNIFDKYPTLGLPMEKDERNTEIKIKNPTTSPTEKEEIFKLWNDRGLPRVMDSNCPPCFTRVARWLRLKYLEIKNQ